MNSSQLGILGEKIAEKYLKKKGYKILDRNYFFRPGASPLKGEIDIIAKNKDIIVFVEVKAIEEKSGDYFLAEDRVDFLKQRKLIKASQSWLMKNKIPFDSKWQIDVLAIKIDFNSRKAKIRHIENAVC